MNNFQAAILTLCNLISQCYRKGGITEDYRSFLSALEYLRNDQNFLAEISSVNSRDTFSIQLETTENTHKFFAPAAVFAIAQKRGYELNEQITLTVSEIDRLHDAMGILWAAGNTDKKEAIHVTVHL